MASSSRVDGKLFLPGTWGMCSLSPPAFRDCSVDEQSCSPPGSSYFGVPFIPRDFFKLKRFTAFSSLPPPSSS
jgi:hypothetical protein